MVSAPKSEGAWLSFVGSVVALYVGLLLIVTEYSVSQALVSGTYYGLSVAIVVALLVVIWRGVPDMLYPESVETARDQ